MKTVKIKLNNQNRFAKYYSSCVYTIVHVGNITCIGHAVNINNTLSGYITRPQAHIFKSFYAPSVHPLNGHNLGLTRFDDFYLNDNAVGSGKLKSMATIPLHRTSILYLMQQQHT